MNIEEIRELIENKQFTELKKELRETQIYNVILSVLKIPFFLIELPMVKL